MSPIAICGIGLRLPGGINTTQDLWDLLINGRDAQDAANSRQRFNPNGFDDSLGNKPSIRNQNGYFLEQDLGLFDPSFFSMSRKEAERCDPQQRLLLEITRECLEDAGEIAYRGKRIGCYVGSFGSTWSRLQAMDPQFPSNYDMTGSEDYMLSNRISYEYDLVGPSMTINTACSASLIALHEACTALQRESIVGAVVGGACLQLSPLLSEMMAIEGTLSPEGSSKSMDEGADGFARAEGITAIYIKRLEDAIQDGNPVRAVIRASGSGSDGSRAGLMQPQASTQEALMRQVYSESGLDPKDTAFVECHATGTSVGDPIEAEAVNNVFGGHGVYIGSIKANIGHTEGSAGLASLIKAVLALEHKIIPPSIKIRSPNPKIPFGHRLKIPASPTSFPLHKKERISINSFGIGGANAHVVVDSFPLGIRVNGDTTNHENNHGTNQANGAAKQIRRVSLEVEASDASRTPSLLLFSANTAHSLRRQAELYNTFASQNPADLQNIAHTRALHRERLPHRSFSIFGPEGRLLKTSDPVKASMSTAETSKPKVVMVFTGQGAQWLGMGKEILAAVPDLRSDLCAMDSVLQGLQTPPDWLIGAALCNPSMSAARFNTAELSQPLCTALQIVLLHYLRRLGILPDAVVGHSSGEIAAAYAAGHISMEMAIKAAYFRGTVTKGPVARGDGGMAVIGLGAKEIRANWLCEGVVVACENSPSSTTISGDKQKVEQVLSMVKSDRPEVFIRLLNVDRAYHSHHMEELGLKYLGLLGTHEPSSSDTYFDCQADFISSVTHEKMDTTTTSKPEYWVRNLVSPVLFSSAVEQLHENYGDAVLVELGPHAALGGPLRQIYDRRSWPLRYIPVQKRSEDCYVAVLDALGQLYQQDVPMNFLPLFNGTAISGLPPYPWDHTGPPLLHESRISKAYRLRKYPRHCLLGLRSPESPDTLPIWRNILDIDDLPWLLDHKVGNDAVFPIAGYMAVVGEAIRQLGGLSNGSGYCLRNVVASTALILKESQPVELLTSLQPKHRTMTEASSWFEFQILSCDSSQWTVHCTGQVLAIATPTPPVKSNGINGSHATTRTLDRPSPPLPRRVSSAAFYRSMTRIGISYGPHFALLDNITASTTKQLAQANLADAQRYDGEPFSVHPAQIDACLHLLFMATTQGLCRRLDQLYVPTEIEELTVHMSRLGDMTVRAEINGSDFSQNRIDCLALNGESILSVRGVHMTPVEKEVSTDAPGKHGLARLEWHPDFDFGDRTSLLRPPALNRDHCKIQQELTFLCILEEADNIRGITPARPHFAALRDWLSNEIQSQSFPLVENAAELAKLSQSNRRSLISKHSTTLREGRYAPVVEACKRVSQHGAALFSGRYETIDILTRENLLTKLYTLDSYGYGQFVCLLAKTRTNLRILEVGAGTGGTTENILHDLVGSDDSGLSPYSTYTFTDVSSGFFNKAKERFAYAPNLEYRVLDISRPPSEQGFKDQGHSYDLIIAANVVHATPRIGETLSNIKWLLKPGGTLLLTELLPTLKTTSYIFGHFSGWWLGESDNRDEGPLMGLEKWNSRLKGSGFTGADSVVYDAEQPYGQVMTIVSHTPHERVQDEANQKTLTLLHTDASSEIVCRLKKHLEQRGWMVQPQGLTGCPVTPNQYVISCVDLEATCFSANLDEGKFEALKSLMRSISAQTLWLMPPVQTGAKQPWAAQILGFVRSLRSEIGTPITTLEVDEYDVGTKTELIIDVFERILRDVDTGTLAPDMEYAIKESEVLVPRFRPISFDEAQRVNKSESNSGPKRKVLCIQKRGLLNTLYWKEAPLAPVVPEGHVEVDIRAVGLNAYDILSAKGVILGEILPEALCFGCEAAGVIRRLGPGVDGFQKGDRVMVIMDGGCLATDAIIPSQLIYHIPDSMDFTEAATIPVCFGTVLHSLVQVGRVEKGQTVLIHSACGGVGLTAIQVCQMVGADMYATVGNEEKVQYLMKTFGIPRERIFSSRDTSFVQGIMRETKGVGVDLVLNSLSGELLQESWSCVAKFGTMIELGVKDINNRSRLDMLPFGENRSYVGVEAIKFVERPVLLTRQFELFFQCAQKGTLRPITPLKRFSANNVVQAFRFLEDASHIGKVAIEIPSEFTTTIAPYIHHVEFDPEGSYILTGGAGGLGRSIATWMVERGAKHLVFLSRSLGTSKAIHAFLSELETIGCSVTTVAGSVDNMEDVHEAIRKSQRPIKGVLHLAMALNDAPLMDMQWSEWQKTINPKAIGAWNLHSALLSHKQEVDFFLMASSIFSSLGASGQANYVAGNAVMEAFCQYRHSLNLPASILNISAIEDIGFISENEQAAQNIKAQDLMQVGEQGFLGCLELAILQNLPNLPTHKSNGVVIPTIWSNPCQKFMGIQTGQNLDDAECRIMWRRDRRMGVYHNLKSQPSDNSDKRDELRGFLVSLATKDGLAMLKDGRAIALLTNEIGKKVYEYLLKPDEAINGEVSLKQMGLDSLSSTELVRWFRSTIGIKIGVLEIMKMGSLKQLASATGEKLLLKYTAGK